MSEPDPRLSVRLDRVEEELARLRQNLADSVLRVMELRPGASQALVHVITGKVWFAVLPDGQRVPVAPVDGSEQASREYVAALDAYATMDMGRD